MQQPNYERNYPDPPSNRTSLIARSSSTGPSTRPVSGKRSATRNSQIREINCLCAVL